MEFILVAPLYFALLGGMFYVGELALNRIRLHVGDHCGTWLAACRFMDKPTEAWDAAGNPIDPIGTLLREHLFGETMELSNGAIWVDRVEDAYRFNHFMAFFKGGVDHLAVSMPDWARGMLFMSEATTGGEERENLDTKLYYRYNENAPEPYRSYSFHRDSLTWPFNYDRSAPAISLVSQNILMNVLQDPWVCNIDGQLPQGSISNESGGTVSRILSRWGE